MPVVRAELFEGKSFFLRRRVLCPVINALNDYSFQVEDLGNGNLQVVLGTRLKIFHDY